MLGGMADVTQILSAIEAGDSRAAAELLPLVYEEMRKLASVRLANEKPGQTLQATALVHEAYLRLVGEGQPKEWSGRGHFFAAAAEAMRRILIETARRKGRQKRGGVRRQEELQLDVPATDDSSVDLLEVDEAITRLAAEHPEKAELVKLRYFAGLSLPEAAAALGISTATASRRWRYARAWLARTLR